jgi:hypothetical protein
MLIVRRLAVIRNRILRLEQTRVTSFGGRQPPGPYRQPRPVRCNLFVTQTSNSNDVLLSEWNAMLNLIRRLPFAIAKVVIVKE